MALAMQATINRWKTQKDGPLGLQIGLHTGTAVGGVIRAKNTLSYDLWGEAVSIAALAGAASPIDGIAVTDAAAAHLGNYRVEQGGQIMQQGRSIPVYLLAGRA
jgi:class 3 adenylate cyclase